jgi:hypothetical protein
LTVALGVGEQRPEDEHPQPQPSQPSLVGQLPSDLQVPSCLLQQGGIAGDPALRHQNPRRGDGCGLDGGSTEPEQVRQRRRLYRSGPGDGSGPGNGGGSVTPRQTHSRLCRLQYLPHHRERRMLKVRPKLGQHGFRRGHVALGQAQP